MKPRWYLDAKRAWRKSEKLKARRVFRGYWDFLRDPKWCSLPTNHQRRDMLKLVALFSGAMAAGVDPAYAFFLKGGGGSPSTGTEITYKAVVAPSTSGQAAGSVAQTIMYQFAPGQIAWGSWPQFVWAGPTGTGTPVPTTLFNYQAAAWKDSNGNPQWLMMVPAVHLTPESVPSMATPNANYQVQCFSGGSLPSPSARGIADFYNGVDYQVQFDLLDAGQPGEIWRTSTTGYYADISGALQNGTFTKLVLYGNGPAGCSFKARVPVKNSSGAVDGQLMVDAYGFAAANLDGSLKGMRIMAAVLLPYYDQGLSTQNQGWVSLSRFQVVDVANSKTIWDGFAVEGDPTGSSGWIFGPNNSISLTITGGNVAITAPNNNFGYSAIPVNEYSMAVRLTNINVTAGTLTTLTTGTTYFTQNPTSTTISLSNVSTSNSAGRITPNAGVSATATMTYYPYLSYFSGVWAAGWDANPIWLQGAGSDSADTVLRVTIDPTNYNGQVYQIGTQTMVPWNLQQVVSGGQTVVGLDAANFFPNAANQVTRDQDQSGDRLDIFMGFGAQHFYLQNANNDLAIRCISLVGISFPVCFENSGNGNLGLSGGVPSMAVLNNGHYNGSTYSSYSGMPYIGPYVSNNSPANNCAQLQWVPGAPGVAATAVGFVNSTSNNVGCTGMQGVDGAHRPQLNVYAYWLFGEPWHYDMMVRFGNLALLYKSGKLNAGSNISSTSWLQDTSGDGVGERNWLNSYNSQTIFGGLGILNIEPRESAWDCFSMAAAAGYSPPTPPPSGLTLGSWATTGEPAGTTQYLNDLCIDTGRQIAGLIATIHAQAGSGMGFADTNGEFCTQFTNSYPGTEPWEQAYFGYAMCFGAMIGPQGESNSCWGTTWGNAAAKLTNWFEFLSTQFSGGWLATYHMVTKSGVNNGQPLAESATQLAFHGLATSWVSGNPGVLTNLNSGSSNVFPYIVQPGDWEIFLSTGFPSEQDNIVPGGLTAYDTYYAENVIGNVAGSQTFNMSNSYPGGTLQNLTNSAPANVDDYTLFGAPGNAANEPPANSSWFLGKNNNQGYGYVIMGFLSWCASLGLYSATDAVLVDLQTRIADYGINLITSVSTPTLVGSVWEVTFTVSNKTGLAVNGNTTIQGFANSNYNGTFNVLAVNNTSSPYTFTIGYASNPGTAPILNYTNAYGWLPNTAWPNCSTPNGVSLGSNMKYNIATTFNQSAFASNDNADRHYARNLRRRDLMRWAA